MTAASEMVIESRVHLLGVLAEAAEIEHNLMCLYLYAMFGMKRDDDESLAPDEQEAVGRWRKVLLGVALEEMSHLALVANLTAAVGGSPQFMRPNLPASPGYYPRDIVIELAPFDLATLAHFVYLERPGAHEVEDGSTFHAAADYHREAPHGRLMPHSGDYQTVGALYRTVRESIVQLADRLGEDALFCGSSSRQLGPLDTRLPGLSLITDKASALAALDTIVTQGEGALAVEGSHFARFQQMHREYVALLAKNPAFAPGRPAARNPVMRKPVNPANRVWVTEPLAVRYMDLGNALYGAMLRMLVQVYAFDDRSRESKRALVALSLEAMHAMATVAETLTHLPATVDDPSVMAGISFAMVRSLAPLELTAEATILPERLREIEANILNLRAELAERKENPAALEVCLAELGRVQERIENMRRIYSATSIARVSAPAPAPAPAPANTPAPAPAPAPTSNVEVAVAPKITMTFEARRCIHARHCVTELPRVFKANTPGTWLFPETADPDQLAATIGRCPSGALQYHWADGREEPTPEVNLAHLRENGPYAFTGDLVIDGKRVGKRATLCRCGLSKQKPFCDGSHNAGAFIASGEPATLDATALAKRDGPLVIDRTNDGPYHVAGNIEICAGTGRIIARTEDVYLCRCGHSQTKPICDGSHARVGFRDPVPG